MPPLEEQFPSVNPLVLQRPDALQPPDREEDEESRPVANQDDDEAPRPGTLADGIDRVTLSRSARAIASVQPTDEIVAVPIETISNAEGETPAADDATGTGLPDFENGIEENRVPGETANRIGQNPEEQSTAPVFAPATPPVPSVERQPSVDTAPRIESRSATEPATNAGRNEGRSPRSENRFVPTTLGPRDSIPAETDEKVLEQNPLGLRGNIPAPPDEQRANFIPPTTGEEDPPGPNIQEARNFGQGRTLSLDLESVGNEDALIAVNTVDEALAEDGALPAPGTNQEPPFELLIAPSSRQGFVAEPDPFEVIESAPNLFRDESREPALADPADIPGPAGNEVAVSSLIDTRQVFEEDQEAQALQAPAFPELDPDEPFVPTVELEAREEDIPAVAPIPNVPPPAFENVVPVAPPAPGNVETLDENPQALRPDNLGTDPALRSNRALRNFLQEFNNRNDSPEAVTESEGGPVTEVQNNAPPPPAVFENLEAVRAELLSDSREQETREGVTRPEEEHTAPPQPRTADTLLTERGQNIDQFI